MIDRSEKIDKWLYDAEQAGMSKRAITKTIFYNDESVTSVVVAKYSGQLGTHTVFGAKAVNLNHLGETEADRYQMMVRIDRIVNGWVAEKDPALTTDECIRRIREVLG